MSAEDSPDAPEPLPESTSDAILAALCDLHHPVKVEMAEWAAAKLVDPSLPERDVACRFWPEGWELAAGRGVQGTMISPAHGGSGNDVVTALLQFEGLGYGCADAGLVFALSTQVWTMQPLLAQFGSATQQERYLPGLADGSIKGAFCITETDSGSDTFAMATTFARTDGGTDGGSDGDGGGFVLNGHKAYVTMAPEADVFLVFATSDPKLGQWGVTTFIVDATLEGVTVGPNRPKMGLRTTPFADVTFDNVELGPESVLGSVGSGAAVFSTAMEAERAFVLSAQIGAMERQLDEAVAYTRTRRQFSQPIGDFQAVSHRLADMKLRHDNARLQLYRAAALFMLGRPSMEAAALAKIQASEAAVASSVDALLTHGARGYVSEFGVERDLRNVAGGIVYGGTSDIQRNIVARMLGQRRGGRDQDRR
ncbi:MAG: acyl-CoA dehydrogenase family protein [Acidimicrobiia bacterium]|nr:acyl-CoA dehydrogenase family protein [Acidimicrobiia bacterium]